MALPKSIRDEVLQKMAHNQESLPSLPEEVEIMISNVNNQNKSHISNLPSPKGNDAQREWGISRREQSICAIRRTSNYSTCSGKQRRQQKQQPGIKHMLRLVSIKSGQDKLCYNGESVSLTQLDSLPLEMQLQVANNDDKYIGRSREIITPIQNKCENRMNDKVVSSARVETLLDETRENDVQNVSVSIPESEIYYDACTMHHEDVALFWNWMNSCMCPKEEEVC